MLLRVLQVVTKMDRAGSETMLMNYYRHINREKVQFDFLTHRSERGSYDGEIEAMGGRIYRARPLSIMGLPKYLKWLKNFFSMHSEYLIVHAHLDSLSAFALWQAKRSGVPVRIAHSHTNAFDCDRKWLLRRIAKGLIKSVATNYLACSYAAGQFMFGKDTELTVIKNAIETERFRFVADKRTEERAGLGFSENDFVVGHVGRFFDVKNHKFLIEVFTELVKLNSKAKLVLAGKGITEEDIKELVAQRGLTESVRFLGEHRCVDRLLNAFDVFVLPSHFEGLGIALIEAQTNGLYCFASDTVSRESAITPNVEYLPLNAPEVWAKKIAAHNVGERACVSDAIKNSDYDILQNARTLQEYYSGSLDIGGEHA